MNNFGHEIIDDCYSYVEGMFVNTIELENNHEELLRKFVNQCFLAG